MKNLQICHKYSYCFKNNPDHTLLNIRSYWSMVIVWLTH